MVSLTHYRSWILSGIMLIGTSMSLLVWHKLSQDEERAILSRFQHRAETQARIAQKRLHLYVEMVHGLANLFASSTQPTRAEFERAAAGFLTRHQGVQALQWVSYVRRGERADFEAAARAEYPGFTITEPGPDGLMVARDHDDHTVIRLMIPLTGNEAALGYDNSRAPIGPDLRTARRLQTLRITHQFRLAQSRSPDDEKGIVFTLPIFRPSTVPGDDGFRGYVQGVFRVETMLAHNHLPKADEALLVQYRDLDATGTQQSLLYLNRAGQEVRAAGATPLDPDAPHTHRTEFRIGGRRWEFLAELNPVWHRQQQSLAPFLTLCGGILATVTILLLFQTVMRRTTEIEQQVAQRTAELEGTKRELEQDIRRRQAAELALQASEQRLEAIIDNSPATIFVKDLAGRYVLCNRGFEQACGRPRAEILGRTDADLYPPDQAATFAERDRRILQTGETEEYDDHTAGRHGPRTTLVHKFPLRNAQGETYAICGIATDITERAAAERQRIEFERKLQQTQRLESLGVLAGGIAHDFNNLLTTVLGNASLTRHQLPAGSPVLAQIGQIEDAARRAAGLCGQMLDYAGKRQASLGEIDLSTLVRNTAALLDVSVPKGARLHLDLARQLPLVEADATQLRQIVMNLVINAAESLGGNNGEIHVSTSLADVPKEIFRDAIQSPDLPGGRYVTLHVSDNGCGIPPAMLARIFEPFYTTKFTGRGLGLSAVLGIVRNHHGALFVESREGTGSTFRLLLPAIDNPAAPPETAPATQPTASQLPRLSGTVLIVDDEIHVREVTALALRQCGLEVLEAPEGRIALRLCSEHGTRIGLIILDLTMPVLSGEETLRQLRQQGADHPVILLSGHSENDATRRCLQLGATTFMQKPYELTALLRLIAANLHPPHTTPG